MKRPAPITKAEIQRAIKAGRLEGAVKVELDAGKFRLSYTLPENNGDKPKMQLAKPRSVLG